MTPLFGKPKDLFDLSHSEAARTRIDEAMETYRSRQSNWETAIDLDGVSGYAFDNENGVLTIEHETGVEGAFHAELLGTYHMSEGEWEWSWNNPHASSSLTRLAEQVRTAGKQDKIPFLKRGRFTLESPENVEMLVGSALGLTDATAVFQSSYNELVIFLFVKTELGAPS